MESKQKDAMRTYKINQTSRYGIIKLTILDLRSKGFSYNKIVKELGCSRGTIAYHLGKDQKTKSLERLRRSRLKRKEVNKAGTMQFDKMVKGGFHAGLATQNAGSCLR